MPPTVVSRRFWYALLAAMTFQCFHASALPWSIRTPLNTDFADDNRSDRPELSQGPAIATDHGGIWIAVWEGLPPFDGGDTPHYQIFFAVSINEGVTWTAPAQLNAGLVGADKDNTSPKLVTDGNGTWLCAWVARTPLFKRKAILPLKAGANVLYSFSTDNGQSWSEASNVNSNAFNNLQAGSLDAQVDIATDSIGNFMAVWQHVPVANGPSSIFFSTINGTAGPWADLDILNATSVNTSFNSSPILTVDGLGNWVCVWDGSGETFGDTIDPEANIFYARSTDVGANWSNVRALNSNAAEVNQDEFTPFIKSDGGDVFVSVWESLPHGDPGRTHIMFSRSTDGGESWAAQQELSNDVFDNDRNINPVLETDGQGNWMVVIEGGNGTPFQTNDKYNILFSTSQDDGSSWSTTAPMNDAPAESSQILAMRPHIASNHAGNWVTVWAALETEQNADEFDNDVDVFTSHTEFPNAGPAADIDSSGVVDAVDVQLVINAALNLAIQGDADIDDNNEVDAVDVQLVINAALAK
jgi:hypothetical protein